MLIRSALIALFVAAISCVDQQSAEAQQSYTDTLLNNIQARNSVSQYSVGRINQTIRNQAVPTAGVGGINRQNFIGRGSSSLGGPASKPFAQIDRGPVVSPYLSLSNPFSTATDYYNIVKPLQEQRRVNDQLSRQQVAQNRRLNQLASRGPYQVTGDENSAPTGHGTGFMNFGAYQETGNYFPRPTPPKER